MADKDVDSTLERKIETVLKSMLPHYQLVEDVETKTPRGGEKTGNPRTIGRSSITDERRNHRGYLPILFP